MENSEIRLSQRVKLCNADPEAVKKYLSGVSSESVVSVKVDDSICGEIHFLVEAAADNDKDCRKLIKPVIKDIKNFFGADIYTTDSDVTLEEAVVRLLQENELSIATAESCTAGLFSGRLVNVPGVSGLFNEGFITYSNKAKHKYLGVKKSTLQKYGAVSEECAYEMAKGAASNTKSDVGVAITGIAGPDGGTDDKPVGLVYIGVAIGKKVVVKKNLFSGNRQEVREKSVSMAFAVLRESLLEYYSEKIFGKNKNKRKN